MLHLSVKTRDKTKKAKEFLREGQIPAVVYGPKTPSTPLAVDYKKFFNIYKEAGETTLIALDIDQKIESKESKEKDASEEDVSAKALAKAENVVLIRDIQVNPVSGNFIHVDFYQLPLDQEIEIAVPVLPQGTAPAVKEQGGILVHNLHEINIKALPTDLIHEIKVDLSGLKNIGDSILVKDLNVSEKVEVLADEEEMVFTVEEPREEEEPEEEVSEEEAIEDIKTEGEDKREEEEAEGEAGEGAKETKKEEAPKPEEGAEEGVKDKQQ